MKALMYIKTNVSSTAGYLVEFKPIDNEWLAWKSQNGDFKLLHEKCYHKIILERKLLKSTEIFDIESIEGICTLCKIKAPSHVKQFIYLVNATKNL